MHRVLPVFASQVLLLLKTLILLLSCLLLLIWYCIFEI